MTTQYYLENIRTLLTKGFNDTELRRLCFDIPALRAVYDDLAENTGKSAIIDKLLERADRHLKLDKLLAKVKLKNPARYEMHQPYYRPEVNPPSEDSEAPVISERLSIEAPYGTMLPTSHFYIERQADNTCWNYLNQSQAATIFIQAPRQMGKSSLMRRMTHRLEQTKHIKTAFIDFERFTEHQLADEESFLVELCFMIGDILELPEAIDQYWASQRRSNLVKCSNYLSQHIIPKLNAPFILALDETERLLNTPWRNDFFGMLRTWHNDRAWNKNFAKMTLFLSSSTEPHLFIDNPNQSPFNVAAQISLQDFTLAEVETLNQRHQSRLSESQLSQLHTLLGGHPFLTRLAFYLLVTQIDFETLLATATHDTGPFGEHLRRYWQHILEMPDIKKAVAQICRHQTHPEDQIYYRLKGAGLIKKEGTQVLMRNKLYNAYFTERLFQNR